MSPEMHSGVYKHRKPKDRKKPLNDLHTAKCVVSFAFLFQLDTCLIFFMKYHMPLLSSPNPVCWVVMMQQFRLGKGCNMLHSYW